MRLPARPGVGPALATALAALLVVAAACSTDDPLGSETAAGSTGGNPCVGVDVGEVTTTTLAPSEEQALDAALEPPITDDSGYALEPEDLAFLDITAEQVQNWRTRQAPLTMSPEQYQRFAAELWDAAAADGVTDADLRMKGSGVAFWAGPHKELPADPAEAAEVYKDDNEAWPSEQWCTIVAANFGEWESGDPDLPTRRPFDSMAQLGVAEEGSDVDIQLSSDVAVALTEAAWNADPALQVEELVNPKYDFHNDEAVAAALPSLTAFTAAWTAELDRPVALKLFASGGPPNEQSGFRPDDWIIVDPQP